MAHELVHGLAERELDLARGLIGDEAEAAVVARVAVHHEGRVHDDAKAGEVGTERVGRDAGRDGPDEELLGHRLVLARHRSLRVNLHGQAEPDEHRRTFLLSIAW